MPAKGRSATIHWRSWNEVVSSSGTLVTRNEPNEARKPESMASCRALAPRPAAAPHGLACSIRIAISGTLPRFFS